MPLKKPPDHKIPEINLIPMLTVMMGVLAFFVVITTTLTREQGIETTLLNDPGTATDSVPPAPPLAVELDGSGQLSINQQPIADSQLPSQIQAYLNSNPEGVVVLQVDRQLPYEQVVQRLGDIRDVAGDRVSLAID